MTISPAPRQPEKFRAGNVFERTTAPSITGNRGPLRFEEGTATETDVPSDFARGAYQDTAPAAGNLSYPGVEMQYKRAADTMRERAHIGSASWIEAPQLLSDFVDGVHSGDQGTAVGGWDRAFNSGTLQKRPSAVRVG